ncbi:hypothetical protein [Falsibacillus albus]|uniref:Uncharacterized protein n=1 Tax=Falsibacillus albus TaxID=2478915 RepID=A0A3L7K172_9BACI|nr:hypothetical protein [Falsibacillus albus]RLQ96818.1 hypothetical protein D9X91_06885 [Falsibacillus albus]
MNELEMKIEPSFVEEDLAIVFSFDFMRFSKKMGEAVVYTFSETQDPSWESFSSTEYIELMPALKNQNGKIAVIHDITILEEYKKQSMNKMFHFLKIIGISKVYFLQSKSNVAVI